MYVYYKYMYNIYTHFPFTESSWDVRTSPMNHLLMESPPEIFNNSRKPRQTRQTRRFLRVNRRISRTKVPFGWCHRRFKDKALHGDDQGGHSRANQGRFLRHRSRGVRIQKTQRLCLGYTGKPMNYYIDIYIIYSIRCYIANAWFLLAE